MNISTYGLAVNDFSSTLASAHAVGDGRLALAAGSGARLGALPADRVYRVTALQSPGTAAEFVLAIFAATGLSGDSLTGMSAVEGTSDVVLAAGTAIEVRITAAFISELQASINMLESMAVGGVSSVFGRTGDVAAQAGDYSVDEVTGAAPLASPTFTGTPQAPTADLGDDSTAVATSAFMAAAVVASDPWNASELQGRDVAATAPSDGQALVWSDGDAAWVPTTAVGPQGPPGDAGAKGDTGATGATGATGPAGVVAATAPLAYDAGTQALSLAIGAGLAVLGGVLEGPTSGGTAGSIQLNDGAGGFAASGDLSFLPGVGTTGINQLTTGGPQLAAAGNSGLVVFNEIVAVPGSAGFADIQIWKDTDPSAAIAIGIAVPGRPATNDMVLSTFAGSGWTEGMRVKSGTGGVAIANGVGFNGATPIGKAATPATLADVITILQNLGLCS